MSDPRSASKSNAKTLERNDRKFSVTTNRGEASHKVRYVESGGAAVDLDECTFCQSVPDISDDGER
ncbi:MAG: hypothetical protein R3295_01065 [Marinobacter sp.]|nr:hypothetical protein [Marinobacter sp.]